MCLAPFFSSPPSIPSWTNDVIPPNNLAKPKLLLGKISASMMKISAFSKDKRKMLKKSRNKYLKILIIMYTTSSC